MVLAAIVVLAAIASAGARTPDGNLPAGTGVIVTTGASMLVEAGCSGVGGA